MTATRAFWRSYDALLDLVALRALKGRRPPETFVPTHRAARHVLLISLDGLRPDAITPETAPHAMQLIARGVYCPVAQTIRPSITRMAHGAMVTGRNYRAAWARHRKQAVPDETIFSLAHQAGLRTGCLVSKRKLFFLARPGSLDYLHGPDHVVEDPADYAQSFIPAEQLARIFEREWQRGKFDLMFLHIGEPDLAGHTHGWMKPGYLEGVTAADRGLGAVLEALRRAGDLSHTAVILTTDHGGSEVGNRSNRPENMTIPWVCAGPGVPAGVRLTRQLHVHDTAPTVLALLGLTPPPGLAGRVVREVFGD